MLKRILISLALLYSGIVLFAQNIEEIQTVNGDIYIGFISEQVPGDYITVYAEQVEITIPKKMAVDLREEFRPFYTLTESAKTWFRHHADTTNVKLASFRYDGNYVDDAKIMSKGGADLNYISFTHKTYRIPWDKLRKINKKAPSVSYGLKEIVTLQTGDQFSGTIIEQLLGEHIIIQTDKGKTEFVPIDEVVSIKSDRLSPDVSIWDQALFLDRVFLENGDIIEGLMETKVMGSRIKLLDINSKASGSIIEREFPLEQIVKYQKFWNPYYAIYQPPVLNKKEKLVLLDGESINLTSLFSDGKLHFVDVPCPHVQVGKSFTIEVRNMDCDQTVKIYPAEYKKFGNKDDAARYGRMMPAIKINAEPISECMFSITGEDTMRCDCTLDKDGIYILSIRGLNRVFALEAVKK